MEREERREGEGRMSQLVLMAAEQEHKGTGHGRIQLRREHFGRQGRRDEKKQGRGRGKLKLKYRVRACLVSEKHVGWEERGKGKVIVKDGRGNERHSLPSLFCRTRMKMRWPCFYLTSCIFSLSFCFLSLSSYKGASSALYHPIIGARSRFRCLSIATTQSYSGTQLSS